MLGLQESINLFTKIDPFNIEKIEKKANFSFPCSSLDYKIGYYYSHNHTQHGTKDHISKEHNRIYFQDFQGKNKISLGKLSFSRPDKIVNSLHNHKPWQLKYTRSISKQDNQEISASGKVVFDPRNKEDAFFSSKYSCKKYNKIVNEYLLLDSSYSF